MLIPMWGVIIGGIFAVVGVITTIIHLPEMGEAIVSIFD